MKKAATAPAITSMRVILYGGEQDERFRDIAAMLSFKTDKETYQVGETVNLSIPGGKSGRILVSLENGSRVIELWKESAAGESTVSFKLTPETSPYRLCQHHPHSTAWPGG